MRSVAQCDHKPRGEGSPPARGCQCVAWLAEFAWWHDGNSLPFRGGSGWGMSTRARSAWQSPSRLKRTAIPIRQQDVFPREGGDPDWAPAFAGEQGSASRPAEERAAPVRPNNRPMSQRTEERAGTTTATTGEPIGCPTHRDKRTVTGCPPPLPCRLAASMPAPTPTPVQAKCRTL